MTIHKHIDLQPPDLGEFDAGPITTDGYEQVLMADRPMGYWRLGDPDASFARDASGHERHGSYAGSVIFKMPGLLAGSVDPAVGLLGGGGWLSVPGLQLPSPLQRLSLSFWLWQPPGAPAADRIVTFQAQSGDGFNVQILTGPAGIDIAWHVAAAGSTYADATDTGRMIAAGQAHHIVCAFDDPQITIHVDGTPAPLVGGIAGQVTGGQNLIVGSSLVGVLDEVALFDRSLDSTTAALHHQIGLTEETPQ